MDLLWKLISGSPYLAAIFLDSSVGKKRIRMQRTVDSDRRPVFRTAMNSGSENTDLEEWWLWVDLPCVASGRSFWDTHEWR